MRLEQSELARCRDVVTRVLQTFQERFRGIDAGETVGPLARCANRLHDDPPAPSEEVALLVRATVAAAMIEVARGRLEWSDLEALAEVYDAVLRRLPETNPLLGFTPDLPAAGWQRAHWSAPTRLWVPAGRVSMPDPVRGALAEEVEAVRREFRDDQGEKDDELGVESEPEGASVGDAVAAVATSQPVDEGGTPPPVRLCLERAEVVPLIQHYALVVEQALDTVALLNAHRLERTIGESADEERRIWELLDGAIATGSDLVVNIEHWWTQNLDSPDEWKVWTPCYVLGSLEDAAAPSVLDRILDDLDPGSPQQVEIAGQGLHLATGTAAPTLIRELRRSPNPLKRAIGVTAGSFARELTSEDVALHLTDPSPLVVEAAINAAGRLLELPVHQQNVLVLLLRSRVPRFVRAAAKALLLHGRPEPSRELEHGTLEVDLGGHLLEFLVWIGSERDVPRIERFVQGRELSGSHLLQIGQFGHPGMWSFLAHFLSDEALGDDAAYALTLLLGGGVEERRRFEATAWQEQLTRVAPDSQTRYRLGKPYGVESVQEEHHLRQISYRELEKRLDEAAIRTGVRVDTPLHGWSTESEGSLQGQFARLRQHQSAIRSGTWEGRCRR